MGMPMIPDLHEYMPGFLQDQDTATILFHVWWIGAVLTLLISIFLHYASFKAFKFPSFVAIALLWPLFVVIFVLSFITESFVSLCCKSTKPSEGAERSSRIMPEPITTDQKPLLEKPKKWSLGLTESRSATPSVHLSTDDFAKPSYAKSLRGLRSSGGVGLRAPDYAGHRHHIRKKSSWCGIVTFIVIAASLPLGVYGYQNGYLDSILPEGYQAAK